MRALVLAGACLALAAPPAAADFGLKGVDVTFTGPDGSPSMQAGSHPFAMTTSFRLETNAGGELVDGSLRELEVELPPGFAGNPTATPRCTTLDFLNTESRFILPQCADSTAVGRVGAFFTPDAGPEDTDPVAIFNLEPPPGVAAKLGFWAANVPVTIEIGLSPHPPYNIVATSRNTSQVAEFFGTEVLLWGNPADPAHDGVRGKCPREASSCPAGIPVRPFLTLPRRCSGPLNTFFRATPWWSGDPSAPDFGPFAPDVSVAETHDGSDPPNPLGLTGCDTLGFGPEIESQPSTDHAESPTGLEFSLRVHDEGLDNPSGRADSDVKKAVVTLPAGITLNPSIAEGLVTCTPRQLDAEQLDSQPGEGCPDASKIGAVEVETPLLEEKVLRGSIFVAQQDDPATPQHGAENPFDSLIAFYLVIRDRQLGILVKQAGLVEPDPRSGQLVSTVDEIPQFPLSDFRLRLREGGRSPLISPPACGTYTTRAELTPWADPTQAHVATSSFEIARGVGGGPCPPSGPPPFVPGFDAGTLSNNAASYSSFHMGLTRRDGDQDLTRFDATLPPGVLAKLAGVARCPDAAIAAAKARTGRAELASPSCPASSEIGHVQGGAGVGSQLTYVPGRLYLAGPVGAAPLSVVGIVPAVAGPFDVGTVVVRQALQVDPRTGEASVDGASSDPIPHILAGIPLRVRDIQVNVDRPDFTLNPTSCDPFATTAQIWGGGAALFSTADDSPVARSARFQAANCSRLGFKPRLSLTLRGGTKRGGHPALEGRYAPKPGHANLAGLALRLPRSAFLDQAHIRTICTRVQFAADACPKAAAYGTATAWTPLLEEPLTGPVYLRSSDNQLPDFVADLHGLVDVEAVARIDSAGGGIRATFPLVPDAPLTKVVVRMQGARKGLIVNSRDLCAAPSRAEARMSGHNGRRHRTRPMVRALGCGGKTGKRRPAASTRRP